MSGRIGLLCYKDPFCDAVEASLRARGDGMEVDHVTLGSLKASEGSPYRVILDRQSYLEAFLQTWMKAQALRGTYVVNNPFAFQADDKFMEVLLADNLGIPAPRTVLLSPRATEYDYGESLEGADLEGVLAYVGLPAVVKPYRGWGWERVAVVKGPGELRALYDASGFEVLLVQEYVSYDHYVRVFSFGKEEVLPIKYDPMARRCVYHPKHLSERAGALVVEYTQAINRALDYDVNTVEYALQGDRPVIIDAFNTVPEIIPGDLATEYFDWCVARCTDLLLDLAASQRRNRIAPGTGAKRAEKAGNR